METHKINPVIPLTLSNIPNIGKKTIKFVFDELKKRNENEKTNDNFSFINEFLIQNTNTIKKINSRFCLPDENELDIAYDIAKNIILESQNEKISIISYVDIDYPEKLKQISDPPNILFAKGNVTLLNQIRSVAIVGTRDPSEYGTIAAGKLGGVCAKNNYVVVSGLAEGCDAAAHEGCLDGDGFTIAVLAHGLHMIYPRQNIVLAERILNQNGCLLSEYAYGVKPTRYSFIDRDRLQSGLSNGVIVVETDVKGGTMHTVGYCLQQKRKLACIQHPNNNLILKQSRGNQLLINEKNAIPVNLEDDVSISNLFNELQNGLNFKRENLSSQTLMNDENTIANQKEFQNINTGDSEQISKPNFSKRGQISLGDFQNEISK